jgi:hypothetical protein
MEFSLVFSFMQIFSQKQQIHKIDALEHFHLLKQGDGYLNRIYNSSKGVSVTVNDWRTRIV